MDDEFVMLFPVSKLHELGYFQGFSTLSQEYLCPILAESFFIERSVAEVDTSLRQLIPYSILGYNDSLFNYRRARRGSEVRLLPLVGAIMAIGFFISYLREIGVRTLFSVVG